MEVDHFNPRRKKADVQKYTNLFLASRHCNGAKGNHWPSHNEQKRGIRFLDCTTEPDYDVHILEDPDTHEVVGVTPEGIFHVRQCDLNDPWLIEERKERSELWKEFESEKFRTVAGLQLPEAYAKLKAQIEKMIPKIEFLCGEALERRRARREALAKLRA